MRSREVFIVGLTILIATFTILIPLNEAIVFKLTNAVCESYNKSAIVIPICRLKAIKRNRAILNVSTNIIHPVSDIRLHLQVLKKANGYKPWLLKTDLDLCQYMRHSNNPMAKIFFDMIQEFTNLNHSCPYVGPVFIQGFYPRPELLRLPFPTGDYILTTRWFYYKKIVADINVSFVFVEDLLNQ